MKHITFITIKKILVIILLNVISIINSSNIINAYDFPSNSCYFHVDDSNLGEVKIYVPCNDSIIFSLSSNGQPVLVSSSNITGYLDSTDDYTINFRPYYVGRFRYSTSSSYIDLNITKIYDDTTIQFYNDQNEFIYKYKDFIVISSLVFIGGALCLIFMKR